MGRHAAGEGFLQGFARHAGVDGFFCYGPNQDEFRHFQQSIMEAAGAEKNCHFIPFAENYRLGEVGCMFVPGPIISNDVWVRRAFNNRAYSICGVTHTTATERVMDSFGALLTDPVQSWDAVVCTSKAVRKTVERVTDCYADYLEARMGSRPRLTVQLPVIPLGVNCEQFSLAEQNNSRVAWREKLGIGDDETVILYVGRFCFTAKVHPLPMFLALEEVARRTRKKVCLILAGWFDPPATENLWKQDVQRYCPSVKVSFVDGRKDDIRREIWSVADIFTSFSDNIQETFGLTPIEAMAAGLPVVVTDWDGYRDTVRHGEDGFRVPVLTPEPGAGKELALRFANRVDNYGRYCGTASQMTTVDIGACAWAFDKLILDAELRQRMGRAGQQRAREKFDWSIVVRQYQDLWKELAERRARDSEIAPLKNGSPSIPLRIDPFTLFQEYPTGYITGNSTVTLRAGKIPGWLEHIAASAMNNYLLHNLSLFLAKGEIIAIMQYLTKHDKVTVEDLTALFPKKREAVIRTLGWMGKTGMVMIQGTRKADYNAADFVSRRELQTT